MSQEIVIADYLCGLLKPYKSVTYWIVGTKSYLLAANNREFNLYGLHIEDYDNLKWEDEPIEVFLNLKD